MLEIYSKLVNRTILRPASLPAPTITLKTVTPLTKQEALQAFDAVLGLNGITMLNVGDKFVKAVPVTQANQEGAAFNQQEAASLPEMGQYVTHIVQLKYVKPSEMVQALQPFAKIPNSILPIESSQILVLRDFTENVKRMLEMIDRIDIAVPAEYISEVIPIKYALASEIASALNSLSTGGGGTTVGAGAGAGRTGAGRTGTGFGGRSGFGTGTTGGYPGSTPGAFGQPGINQPTTPTPGGTGSTFTDRLQNIIRRAAVSGEIQILGQTKIIADERTNSLLIFASREDMKMIKDIVAKLDVVLAQVLIEAVVIEVDLGPDTKNMGVSYASKAQHSGQWTGVGAGGAGQFLGPNNFPVPGGLASAATNAAGAVSGGFNYLFSYNQDLDVTVTAIESSSRARILQRPRIQTSHAVNATIFVGESRPYPTSSYYGGGSFGGYSSIQQLEIGVTLDVTPLINVEGLVVMDIHQTIESVNGSVTIQNVGDVPVTSRKEAQAKVAVKDKQTIMLGGLIETDKSKNASGVPILMNIPILGYLFRSSNSSETRKELIVLIRPTVLPTPQAAADVATLEKSKMPGVVRAEQEMKLEEEKAMKDSEEQKKKLK